MKDYEVNMFFRVHALLGDKNLRCVVCIHITLNTIDTAHQVLATVSSNPITTSACGTYSGTPRTPQGKEWVFSSTPRFSAAGMVRVINHGNRVGSSWFLGAKKLVKARQSREFFQDRKRRRTLHHCIQTALFFARRDSQSACGASTRWSGLYTKCVGPVMWRGWGFFVF